MGLFSFVSLWRLLGIVIALVGLVGVLGVLGDVNPLKNFSNPLFGLTRSFLSSTASLIFWIFFVIAGLSLAGPNEGYIKYVHDWRR